MKHNKFSYCVLSLLLSTVTLSLFCSCNKNPVSAMASGVSSVAQEKRTDRYINSDGGLGEAVVNDEWLVREKLRECQDKERSLSVDLKFAKEDLQSEKENSEKCLTSLHECEVERKLSDEMLSFCENRYEDCVEKSEELGRNGTTIQGRFESQITNPESQIANLEENYTEYVTTLNKSQVNGISTITVRRDDLITLLENTKHQVESLQKQYDKCVRKDHTETIRDLKKEITALTAREDDLSTQLAVQKSEMTTFATLNDDLKNQLEFQKNQTESLQESFAILRQASIKSNHMQATLGSGGFLLGVVGVGGFVWSWRKMLNNLKQKDVEVEKIKRERAEEMERAAEAEREKDRLTQELGSTARALVQAEGAERSLQEEVSVINGHLVSMRIAGSIVGVSSITARSNLNPDSASSSVRSGTILEN